MNSIIPNITSSFFLWIGLFTITRTLPFLESGEKWWHRPSIATGLAMLFGSWQMFGVAIRSQATSLEYFIHWIKLTWWTSTFSVFFFFLTSLLIFNEIAPKFQKGKINIIISILFSAAVILSILSVSTEWILQFSKGIPTNTQHLPFYIPSNTGAHLLITYQLLLSWAATFLLVYIRKNAKQQDLISILTIQVWGCFLSSLGLTIILISGFYFKMIIPEQVGDVILTLGMLVVSQGIIKYNAITHNRVLFADLLRSFFSVTIVAAFYTTLGHFYISHYGPTLENTIFIPSIVYFTILIHTPLSIGRSFLDQILPNSFLPKWEKEYIKKTDKIRFDVLTSAEPQTALMNAEKELKAVTQKARKTELEKIITDEIETIFRHKGFQNDSLLSESKLFGLFIVQEELHSYILSHHLELKTVTFLDRANIIRSFLGKSVEQLIPNPNSKIPSSPTPEWIHYIILKEKYINKKNRSDVEDLIKGLGIQTSGGAYSRRLQTARKQLVNIILEKEVEYRK